METVDGGRSKIIDLCKRALELDDNDFHIFISELEKNSDPLVQAMYTYLYRRKRGVTASFL